MKKFVSIWLLVLLTSMSSIGQKINVDLTLPDSIAGKQWVIDQIRKAVSGEQPSTGINPCKAGPELKGVFAVSTTGLNGEFHGENVVRIKWAILDASGKEIRYGDVKPEDSKPRIQFEALPPGSYTLTFRGSSCSSKIFTYPFTIPGETGSVLKDCEKKPSITSIIPGPEGATVVFDAKNLKALTLTLLSDPSTSITSASYNPESNTLYFKYGIQSPGEYLIRLTPVSCKWDPFIQPFTIKENGTGVIVPPVTDPPAGDPTAYNYSIVTKGHDNHLNLTVTKSGDVKLLNDLSHPPLPDGYEYRYLIGAELIKQSTPLKDYIFAGHNPLRVIKFQTKKGLETLNKWSDKPEEGGYYDYLAGQSFYPNVTAGLQTGVFLGPQQKSGFLNHIPQSYNPDLQAPQWADIMPDLKLSKGRVFFLNRGEWSMEQVMKKGITHISHHQIPRPGGDESLAMQLKDQGITYNDVPTMISIFELGDNGVDKWVDGYNTRYWQKGVPTKEWAIQQAKRYTWVDNLWIGETMEGSVFMPAEKPFWFDFYKTIGEQQFAKFDSKGIRSYRCHNYFMFWPSAYHLGQSSRDALKALLRKAPADMPRTNFSPGGSLSSTNLIVEAVYLSAPDIQNGSVYDAIYKLNVFKALGYEGGIFPAGVHEWKPNNYVEYRYPDGKWYNNEKIPIDPNSLISYAYLSQVYGKVFVEWGGGAKISTKDFSQDWATGAWYANGSNTPTDIHGFPHKTGTNSYYFGYNASTDLSRFGLQLWADTWGKCEDGETQYLEFRIDGGDWVKPQNAYADDIVDAYFEKRGVTYSIRKDGKIAWFYLNTFADNRMHTIDVVFPNGKIVSEKVAGNGIHTKIQYL